VGLTISASIGAFRFGENRRRRVLGKELVLVNIGHVAERELLRDGRAEIITHNGRLLAVSRRPRRGMKNHQWIP